LPGISLTQIYDSLLINKKGKEVIIAVLDSEIDIEHKDIKKHIWKNEDEIPNNETDVIKGKMNFERYMPFKYCIDQYFIFDKTNYSSCPISKELYNNLWNNNIELIDSEIKNKLITINVII
jgi:hypothetical protein